MPTRSRSSITALLLTTSWFVVILPVLADPPSARSRADRLKAVRRFAYQLQKLDVKAAARSSADMIVVDPQTDGGRLSASDIGSLKKKPDGGTRVVLAYLSIGEAEDYRPYWQASWKTNPPSWLGPENPDWRGNYKVRYWDPAWQATILGKPSAPLDRIVADGFDGVYLDIIDGFEFWEARGQKDARTLMVEWVGAIAAHARKSGAGFLVIPQNGEALAEEPGYIDRVDAIGREDLFFNGDKRQDPGAIVDVQAALSLFLNAGKPVFLIEYCRSSKNAANVYRRARASGYTPLITVRPLDQLIVAP